MIVLAAGGEHVAIRRESQCSESARIAAQGIKIVATATPRQQAPLETSQVNLARPWPVVFELLLGQPQITVVQSCCGSVHVGRIEVLLGALTLFGFRLRVMHS